MRPVTVRTRRDAVAEFGLRLRLEVVELLDRRGLCRAPAEKAESAVPFANRSSSSGRRLDEFREEWRALDDRERRAHEQTRLAEIRRDGYSVAALSRTHESVKDGTEQAVVEAD